MAATFPFGQKIANVPIGTKVQFGVVVTTTPTLIVAANSNRSSVLMGFVSGVTVYLGRDASVSTTNYILALAAGQILTDDDSNDDWYGVTASGSVTVRGCEIRQ